MSPFSPEIVALGYKIIWIGFIITIGCTFAWVIFQEFKNILWPKKESLERRADNLSIERERRPEPGDWTYNAEKNTDGFSSRANPLRAWKKKEDAIADYKSRCSDMPTLILLQYQECIERTTVKWHDAPEFVLKYPNDKERTRMGWREIERIEHEQSGS